MRKWLIAGGVLYGLLLLLALTAARLPGEKIFSLVVERLSKGQVMFRPEKVTYSLPLGYRFDRVSYGITEGAKTGVGRLEALTIDLDFRELLSAYLPFRFLGTLPGDGAFHGNTGISLTDGGQRGYLQVDVSGIDLEKLGVIGSLSDRKVKGRLTGSMSLKGKLLDPSGLHGEGRFLIQKGSVDTRMDLAGLESVPFDSIRLPFSIKQGQVSLNTVEMNGPMFSGTVAGHIRLEKKIGTSQLELTASLKPGPLLEKNPLAGPFLARIKKAGDRVVLKLRGSIHQPSMSWSSK